MSENWFLFRKNKQCVKHIVKGREENSRKKENMYKCHELGRSLVPMKQKEAHGMGIQRRTAKVKGER